MGTPKAHGKVCLIIGVLSAFDDLLDAAAGACEKEFGAIALRSDTFPFDCTDYYEHEMGVGIRRRFLSFAELVEPSRLPDIKLRTNDMEAELARARPGNLPRPVNLDPGYLTLSKLVLATTKDHAHRIYLRDGIYAEVTLSYRHGAWQPMPWTYPDYRTEAYVRFFDDVRTRCRPQLAAGGAT